MNDNNAPPAEDSAHPDQNTSPSIDASDALRSLLERLDDADPAESPDIAGALAAVLASKLEGTPLPDEVLEMLDVTGDSS